MAVISVPASTANLGSGFDALGMALELRAVIGLPGSVPGPGGRLVEPGHPAAVAFAAAGGEGVPWVRSPIPAGRGLGFSGAMRVGGVVAAHHQQHPDRPLPAAELLEIAVRLEGHADNAAASMHGGVVVAAGDRVVRVPLALDPVVVVWVPDAAQTSTDHSRRTLPSTVSLAEATFNVGRAALLVAALATGRTADLRVATEDRLHQQIRLRAVPHSAAALDAALAGPAWAAWLSGSGPSVAALCDRRDALIVADALPATGSTKLLDVAGDGVTLLDDAP